jgi:kynurenine formamidase
MKPETPNLDTQSVGRWDGDSNWGRWGEDDQVGAGNLLTPDVVRAATGSMVEGRVLSLALPIDARHLPALMGRPSVVHTLRLDAGDYLAGARALDDVKSSDDHLFLSLHGVTHVDGLVHTWYGEHLYNGFPEGHVRSSGARRLGAENLAPMVTRGVLVDCVSFLPSPPRPGDPISRADIETVLEAEGVELRPGDVVLVRTGWLRDWREAGESADLVDREQGLATDTAELWIENDIVGIGTDNCTLEVWPHPQGRHVPLHRILIRDYGMYLMEMLDLEELAASGRFEFLFVGAPLPVVGGTGSPLNPLAVL